MRRIKVLALLALGWVAAQASAQTTYPYCQIVDGTEIPAWIAAADYTASSRVEGDGGKDVAVWHIGGGGGLYYLRTEYGDVDFTGWYDIWAWDGSGGINLPDQTAALRLRADYTYRTMAGTALRVGLKPGFYGDLGEVSFDSFFLPFEVLAIQSFNPQISGAIGIAVYPGFDRVFDPRFGVRIAPVEEMRVDVMYPESRVTYRPAIWEVYAGVRHEAVNEFRLEEDDPRDLFGVRETRAYVGGAWPVNDVVRMLAEIGMAFNREFDFKNRAPSRDIEDAWFIKIGVGGAL